MMIHALWCHPRSVSTAFERIMRERGDLRVLHEPFMYHHYFSTTDRLFPDFSPEPGHPRTYADIRALIRTKAADSPVFFKDMAYYVLENLPDDAAFADQMSHAFLIRHPAEAVVSYANRDSGFTQLELGHEAQHRLYTTLVERGHKPLVMTADQLRHDPQTTLTRYWSHVGLCYMQHAFTWGNSVPDGWRSVASWHSEVLDSGAIKPPEPVDAQARLDALGAPFVDYVTHHLPFYARMQVIAEIQAHQK